MPNAHGFIRSITRRAPKVPAHLIVFLGHIPSARVGRHIPNWYMPFPQWTCCSPCGFAYKLTERPESPLCPMSPGAPWWTIMTSALQSDIQTFPGTSLTLPEGCAKINANNRLTNLEFAIVEFDFAKGLCPHKNLPTCTPVCYQATTHRLPSAVMSASTSAVAARRDLCRLLSSPSVFARNCETQDDLNLEKSMASQEW